MEQVRNTKEGLRLACGEIQARIEGASGHDHVLILKLLQQVVSVLTLVPTSSVDDHAEDIINAYGGKQARFHPPVCK